MKGLRVAYDTVSGEVFCCEGESVEGMMWLVQFRRCGTDAF